MRLAGYLEHPSVSLLDHIVQIQQQIISNLENLRQEHSSSRWHNKANSGSPFYPSIGRLRPFFYFFNIFWIHLDKRSHGMITKGITFRSVIYIFIYPIIKNLKIFWLVLFPQRIGSIARDECFFTIVRFK
jgi:hypothetical protein